MSPTASLRRWAQYIRRMTRHNLRRFLVYSLSVLGEEVNWPAVCVIVKKGNPKGRRQRVWLPGTHVVERDEAFVTLTDPWGNVSMFRSELVERVVHGELPRLRVPDPTKVQVSV